MTAKKWDIGAWQRQNPTKANEARLAKNEKRKLLEQSIYDELSLAGEVKSQLRPGRTRLESAVEQFWEDAERGKPVAQKLLIQRLPHFEVHHHVKTDVAEVSARLAEFLAEKQETILVEGVREH